MDSTQTLGERVPNQVQCRFCNETTTVFVRMTDWEEYTFGSPRLIQNIFPYLSPAERELFVSGMCGKCWNKTFSDREY